MKHYVCLATWTDAGIKTVKESAGRWDAFKALCEKHGAKANAIYMTMGIYDLVVHVDAPDDETMARIVLAIGASGNIRTTTLPAFDEAAYRKLTAG